MMNLKISSSEPPLSGRRMHDISIRFHDETAQSLTDAQVTKRRSVKANLGNVGQRTIVPSQSSMASPIVCLLKGPKGKVVSTWQLSD